MDLEFYKKIPLTHSNEELNRKPITREQAGVQSRRPPDVDENDKLISLDSRLISYSSIQRESLLISVTVLVLIIFIFTIIQNDDINRLLYINEEL